MTKKYILTGGPGSGKTSILLELEARGEYVVREASEDIIRRYQKKGIEKPWEQVHFQLEILNLQVQREERVPREIKRVFIDRGIPDGLAYAEPASLTFRCIQQQTQPNCIPYQYHGIFLIENLGQTETNKIRREGQSEAIEIEKRIARIYSDLGYEVQGIGPGTIENRADRILEIIANGKV
jgi:predicted ATPase